MKSLKTVALLAASFALIATSCTQTPTRKKMPGYLNAEDFELANPFSTKAARTADYALATANEDVMFEGSVRNFVTVPLPDPAMDLFVADIVEKYKTGAASMIALWAKQNNQGVIIDLRSGSDEGSSSSFKIEKKGEFSLPVIFRWNNSSSSRAQVYMALLQNTPDLIAKRIN